MWKKVEMKKGRNVIKRMEEKIGVSSYVKPRKEGFSYILRIQFTQPVLDLLEWKFEEYFEIFTTDQNPLAVKIQKSNSKEGYRLTKQDGTMVGVLTFTASHIKTKKMNLTSCVFTYDGEGVIVNFPISILENEKDALPLIEAEKTFNEEIDKVLTGKTLSEAIITISDDKEYENLPDEDKPLDYFLKTEPHKQKQWVKVKHKLPKVNELVVAVLLNEEGHFFPTIAVRRKVQVDERTVQTKWFSVMYFADLQKYSLIDQTGIMFWKDIGSIPIML